MDEREWELDFENFDWESSTADELPQDDELWPDGADGAGPAGPQMSDEELHSLFSALDGVRADDALRATTLEAALSDPSDPEQGHGRKSGQASGQTSGRAPAKTPRHAPAHLSRSRRPRASRPRRLVRHLLVACLAIALVGVASWFVPLTTVSIAQDQFAVTLGVNVYGVTVRAEASDELSEQVVERAQLSNQSVADAVSKVLDAYEEVRGGDGATTPTVDVISAVGLGSDGIREQAQRAAESHAPAASETQAPPASEAAGAAQGDAQENRPDATAGTAPDATPSAPSAPAQQDSARPDGSQGGDSGAGGAGADFGGGGGMAPQGDQSAPGMVGGNGGGPGAPAGGAF